MQSANERDVKHGKAGLQITAGQGRLSGQILRRPDNLCGHLRW